MSRPAAIARLAFLRSLSAWTPAQHIEAIRLRRSLGIARLK